MKNIDEHIDLIERYLYDDLTQEELDDFNELLRKDPEFNKLFYEMDQLLDGVRRSAKKTTVEEKLARLEEALPYNRSTDLSERPANVIKRIFQSFNEFVDHLIIRTFNLDREELTVIPIDNRGRSSVYTITGRIKLIAASSLVMIFLAATFIFTQFSALTPVELYADNYSKPVLLTSTVRSGEMEPKGESSISDIMNSANIAFNSSNFGEAIALVEGVSNDELTPGLKYCGALSYMEIEEFDKAKDLLLQLNTETDIVWRHTSSWFLALCYVREDDKENAVKYLKMASDTAGGEYQEKAANLLGKVK